MCPRYRPVLNQNGKLCSLDYKRTRHPNPPAEFLGKTSENAFNPVVVAWKVNREKKWGDTAGLADRGGLYWAPADMSIPTCGQYLSPETGAYIGEFVAIEMLMWVLEPKRLSQPVTGSEMPSFSTAHKAPSFAQRDQRRSKDGDSAFAKARRRADHNAKEVEEADAEVFRRQSQFAQCVVDQIRLFTQMCRGRSYNVIYIMEKYFSFELLMAMASNPWLPYRFRAAVVDFLVVMFVDRFPQIGNCGAPHLPEQLWLYVGALDATPSSLLLPPSFKKSLEENTEIH